MCRPSLAVIALFQAAFLSACVTASPYRPGAPRALGAGPLPVLAPTPEPEVFGKELSATFDGYRVWTLNLRSLFGDGNEGSIRLTYYDVEAAGPNPVIVALPILAGDAVVARIFARYFAKNGYPSVVIQTNEELDLLNDLDAVNETLETVVRELQVGLSWIEAQDELDAGRIGLMGVSMGGIKAALLAELDPRIAAAVLVLTGGDLPYIITHSREPGVRKRVIEYIEAHAMSREDLERQLRERITFDPLLLAHGADPAALFMILSRMDRTVHYSRQKALRRALGKPAAVFLPLGHKSSLFYLPYIKRRAHAFFKKRLGKGPRKNGTRFHVGPR